VTSAGLIHRCFWQETTGGSNGLDGGHLGRLCAPERDLCKRRDGSGMGADRAAAAAGAARRAAALDVPASGGECGVLPAAGRMPVAHAAAGLPATQHWPAPIGWSRVTLNASSVWVPRSAPRLMRRGLLPAQY
jgi:hypothetical protein